MLKFPPDKLFKSDTIHDWLVADSKFEKPMLPQGTHEKVDAMAVWHPMFQKLMRGGADHFLNSLAQGKKHVADYIATTGVGFTVGMLIKSGISEDLPNGPTCAAIAISSRICAQILTKGITRAKTKPPTHKALTDLAVRALSSPDWKTFDTAQRELVEVSVKMGNNLDLQTLEKALPSRFPKAKRERLIENMGRSLSEISDYKPETPIRRSLDAVKQKIKEQQQDFTR